jgi:hypothetical protein
MTPGPSTIRPSARLADAVERMRRQNLTNLPVPFLREGVRMSSQAYLLADQPSELERLQLQSRVWEPSGRRLLHEIGEGRGARVVDIGCGAIGWLRLLSEWVGPTARWWGQISTMRCSPPPNSSWTRRALATSRSPRTTSSRASWSRRRSTSSTLGSRSRRLVVDQTRSPTMSDSSGRAARWCSRSGM